jgi:hypothetical protein
MRVARRALESTRFAERWCTPPGRVSLQGHPLQLAGAIRQLHSCVSQGAAATAAQVVSLLKKVVNPRKAKYGGMGYAKASMFIPLGNQESFNARFNDVSPLERKRGACSLSSACKRHPASS